LFFCGEVESFVMMPLLLQQKNVRKKKGSGKHEGR
jgi:hypothetical protein